MSKIYRKSREYIHTRQRKLLKHKILRKSRMYNPERIRVTIKKNNILNVPMEISLLHIKSNLKNEFVLPNSFSITNNPKETIETINEIADCFFRSKDLDITINCGDTIDMDLSALVLLDIVIVKGTKYLNKIGYKCLINGELPKDLSTKELFIYSGLPRHLNLLDTNKNEKVELLDPFQTIDDTNRETHRIIEYYNNCLRRNGYELNDKGKVFFYNLINEIVDNARIHNGYKDKFYCSGFYSDGTKKGQLSIISFGKTIYESLNSESTSEKIKNKINDYVECQKSFFDIGYNEEISWTVYALQYKISRFNNTDMPDRGTGTIRFMESFMEMGQSNNLIPLMSLTSGNTHIFFDGTYTLKEESVNGIPVKIIAFNKLNDLKEKPDPNYVKDIHIKFPGVIINVEFYVDRDNLVRFKDGDENG